MANTQAVWGIDLGRCALKAIKLRVGADDKVEIVACDYIEHDQDLSQAEDKRHELIAAALEKFLSRNDISKDAVAVSVPGQQTLARFTKLPPVAPKRIPDIVRYEADQQIPFDMDEVIWDYQTFESEGLPDLEVGIFAIKRELLREHLLHFEQASIEPIAVQTGPLGVYNAAYFDECISSETTIMLDIGATNADLVIGTQHSLWTRTIQIGGNHFTEALVKAFKLSFAKAESLKRSAETSKYKRQIFQAMRPVFADLVQELQRSIGFYSSTHREAQIDKIVGCGNAFRLPGLAKYLHQNLDLEVEVLSAPKNSTISATAMGEVMKDDFLSFTVAYGIALQSLEKGKIQCNLLPTEIAKQLVWRKKKPAFAAAAACLLLAGAMIWFRQSADMSALAAANDGAASMQLEQAYNTIRDGASSSLSNRAQAQAILTAGKTLKSELGRLRGQGQAEREETEELVELMRNKTIVPKITKILHDALPVPKGALGQATTVEEVQSLIASGAVPPRDQRHQMEIESFDIAWEPNLHAYEWDSVVTMPEPIIPFDDDLSGFWVKITCTTPNKQAADFIDKNYIRNLRKLGSKPGEGFYFDRIAIYRGEKVELKQAEGERARKRFNVRPLGNVGRNDWDAIDPLDPITNESRKDDWRFDLYVDVVLEDYPEDLLGNDDPEGD